MRRHHWIITVQYRDGVKIRTHTANGTVTPYSDATRQTVFEDALTHTLQQLDITEAAVLHYTLEPDEL
ncbi:hypothetical protein [Streptomyces sp. NRRL F-5630]|uniref:hypothetical protein n=1 Tax=Streptomyces sp. NRRL F-5630 TaxID=1463864 RepID=UPI003D731951